MAWTERATGCLHCSFSLQCLSDARTGIGYIRPLNRTGGTSIGVFVKIITSLLQLVPALLCQVGVSQLLQAAKGSPQRDSSIQGVWIHHRAAGALFPARGFPDPEVQAQQEPGGPSTCCHVFTVRNELQM